MHFFPTIFEQFSILGIAISQASFLSVGINNVSTREISDEENTVAVAKKTSNRRNAIAVKSDMRNKGAKKPKKSINLPVKIKG